jgi:DNA invertase Pin-like site-specific DNA recombinase
MPDPSPAPAGFSYVRFSSTLQERGDSVRRQTERAAGWFQRNGVPMDTSLNLSDLGVSAFRGKHRTGDRAALGGFLKLVESGRVPAGSFLVVEALDRLTREEIQPALILVLSLLQTGIKIVQLTPAELVYTSKSQAHEIMLMLVELMRGHGESKVKSERLASAWQAKKDRARKEHSVQTTRASAWLRVVGRRKEGKHVVGGRFEVIPERAAVVRKIFKMACGGHGLYRITDELTRKGVKPWGPSGKWSSTYVHKILVSRAAAGAFQPKKGGVPDGDEVPGFFPAVVSEATWRRAQDALRGRRDRPGGGSLKRVPNLFGGLLWDARTGSRVYVVQQTHGTTGQRKAARCLVARDTLVGLAPKVSFPHPVFEGALLELLDEINPADVLGPEPAGEAAGLAGELAGVEAQLRGMEAEFTAGDEAVPTFMRAVRALEERRRDLLGRLSAARQREQSPLNERWGELKTLLKLAADPESRLRLRDVIRGVVEEVRVLVVARPPVRLCAVQMHFREGGRRDYLIVYKAAGTGRGGGGGVFSLADVAGSGALDLRNPADVRRLEADLLDAGPALLARVAAGRGPTVPGG